MVDHMEAPSEDFITLFGGGGSLGVLAEELRFRAAPELNRR
jgi:hypothetical protein